MCSKSKTRDYTYISCPSGIWAIRALSLRNTIHVNVLKCTWLGVGVYNIFRGRVIYDDPSSNFCMLSMFFFMLGCLN